MRHFKCESYYYYITADDAMCCPLARPPLCLSLFVLSMTIFERSRVAKDAPYCLTPIFTAQHLPVKMAFASLIASTRDRRARVFAVIESRLVYASTYRALISALSSLSLATTSHVITARLLAMGERRLMARCRRPRSRITLHLF